MARFLSIEAVFESVGLREGVRDLRNLAVSAEEGTLAMDTLDLAVERLVDTLGILASAAAVFEIFKMGFEEATETQRATAALAASYRAVGLNLAEYTGTIEKALAPAAQFGFTTAQTTQALATLTAMTGNAGGALKELPTVINLAADGSMSLAQASEYVARGMDKQWTYLTRLFPTIKNYTDQTDRMNEMNRQAELRAAGVATSFAEGARIIGAAAKEAAGAFVQAAFGGTTWTSVTKTLVGWMQSLQQWVADNHDTIAAYTTVVMANVRAFGDFARMVGEVLLPVLKVLAFGLTTLITSFSSLFEVVRGGIGYISEASGAFTEFIGKLTGDKVQQAEGARIKAAGEAMVAAARSTISTLNTAWDDYVAHVKDKAGETAFGTTGGNKAVPITGGPINPFKQPGTQDQSVLGATTDAGSNLEQQQQKLIDDAVKLQKLADEQLKSDPKSAEGTRNRATAEAELVAIMNRGLISAQQRSEIVTTLASDDTKAAAAARAHAQALSEYMGGVRADVALAEEEFRTKSKLAQADIAFAKAELTLAAARTDLNATQLDEVTKLADELEQKTKAKGIDIGTALHDGIVAGLSSKKGGFGAAFTTMTAEILKQLGQMFAEMAGPMAIFGSLMNALQVAMTSSLGVIGSGVVALAVAAGLEALASSLGAAASGSASTGGVSGGVSLAGANTTTYLMPAAGQPFAAGNKYPGLVQPIFNIIGPGDPKAQRAIAQIVTNAKGRGYQP